MEKTALMISAKRGNVNILKTLLQNSAAVDLQDSEGRSALILAAYKSSTESDQSAEYLTCIELLIEAKADVNLMDDKYHTALKTACKYGKTNQKVVISLLEAGTDIDETDDEDDTPLHKVFYSGEVQIQSILIDYGADVNRKNGDNKTIFQMLAQDFEITGTEKECKMVQMLLDAGADPNLNSVMCLAASNYKPQMIRLILKGGADINSVDPAYGSILHNTAYTGFHEFPKITLEYKTKINICMPYDTYVHPEESDKFALMLTYAAGE